MYGPRGCGALSSLRVAVGCWLLAFFEVSIPVIVNPASGAADGVIALLRRTDKFDVRVRAAADVPTAVRAAVLEGHGRIAVAGGDGTIALAANVLAGHGTELAVIPAGTLNHFARDYEIPGGVDEAAALAWQGAARPVDIGRVNGRVFLNTASVGAYPSFVRMRERIEPAVGYRLASLMAAGRVAATMHRFALEVATPAGTRIYRSPLLFIGIGERKLQLPLLGARVPGGRRGLHIMVVRGRRSSAILRLGLAAAMRGLSDIGDAGVDELIADRCAVTLRRPTRIATDGELATAESSLRCELARDALWLVQHPDSP